MIKNVIDMFSFNKTLIKANKNTKLQINSVSDIKIFTKNIK